MSRLDDSLREELSAYIDGALDESRVREVERLIEVDADVRAEHDALRRCVGMLHALSEEPAPPVLRERVLDRLSRGRVLRLPVWVRGAVPLAAALLLLVLVWPSGPKETGTQLARKDEDRFVESRDADAGLGVKVGTLDATVKDKEMRAPSAPDASRPGETEESDAAKVLPEEDLIDATVKDKEMRAPSAPDASRPGETDEDDAAKVLREVDLIDGVAKKSVTRRGKDLDESGARGLGGKKAGGKSDETDHVVAFVMSGVFRGADEKRAYLTQLGASDPGKIKLHIQSLAATLALRNDREQKPSTFAFDDAWEAAQVRQVLQGAYGNQLGFFSAGAAADAPAGVRLEGVAKDDAAGAESSFGDGRKGLPQAEELKAEPGIEIDGAFWGAYELSLTVPSQDLPRVYLWMRKMAAGPLPKPRSVKKSGLEKMKRSRVEEKEAEDADEAGGAGVGGGGLAGRRSRRGGDAGDLKLGAKAEKEASRTIFLTFYYRLPLPADPAAAKEEKK